MELFLFDDDRARAWAPFATTRPVGELRFGAWSFRARAERFAGVPCRGHLAGASLAGFTEEGAAPGLPPEPDAVPTDRPRLFLSSRAVAEPDQRFAAPAASGVVRIGDQPAGWYAAPGEPGPPPELLRDPAGVPEALPTAAAHAGRLVERVWHLVTGMAAQIETDFAALPVAERIVPVLPGGVHVLGDADGRLHIAQTARIEPGVILDVSHGPIVIDQGCEVRAFSRIAGPSWIGPRATLLGGVYDAVSIGPVCRVHGEVEETTFAAWSNKAHDGFLGHAYIGCWVNLGALTTNSDLKNNYGSIRMTFPDGEVDTGVIKMGCLLGDHVKTGIGVMLNTGTVVGAGSNLFGAAQPPKHVPPFSWGSGSELGPYRLDRFLEVAERVMARRNVRLSEGMRGVLASAWREARG